MSHDKHQKPHQDKHPAAAQAQAKALPQPALDQDGFADGLLNGTPLAGVRMGFEEFQKYPDLTDAQKNSLAKNDVENMQQTVSVDTTNKFDPAWFTQGVNANVPKLDNGDYVQFPDVLIARGTHRDLSPMTLAELPDAIAYWTSTGVWPVIKHEVGPVADQAG